MQKEFIKKKQTLSQSPSPGAYDTEKGENYLRTRIPDVIMKKESVESQKNIKRPSPSPGAYEIDEADKYLRPRVNTVVMHKETTKREKITCETPAPGEYDLE